MVASAQYRNRADGGKQLADALRHHVGEPGVVLGLPRGGLVTASVVASELGMPLDLVVAQKLGHPASPEYAIGAVNSCGELVLNPVASNGCTPQYLHEEQERKLAEAKRHTELFRTVCPETPLKGKVVILVDDGIATGFTMRAAVLSVLRKQPKRVVVAAPVASDKVFIEFEDLADEVVVPRTPRIFFAVGAHYAEFAQVADDEVLQLLAQVGQRA